MGNILLAEANEPLGCKNVRTKEQVLESLVKQNSLTKEAEVSVSTDLHMLNDYGATIECIEDVRVQDGNNIFLLKLDETTTCELEIEQTVANDVLVKVSENDIYNEVLFKADGTIYLDGIKVSQELETEAMSNNQRTGGFVWYTVNEAPTYLLNASYGAFTVTQQSANIALTKALSEIAYETFKMLMQRVADLVEELVDMTFTIFENFRIENPYSDALSYKVYTAKCTNNVRYLKRCTTLYPKKNYNGTPRSSYRYGVLI